MNRFFSEPEHQPFHLGESKTGVLMVHGFPGTPADVRPLGKRLSQAGLAVHGLLLPGFGAEIARLGETNRQIWLEAVIAEWQQRQAQYDRMVLVGFSMGGALAIRAVTEAIQPDLLVLLAPFWRLGGWEVKLLPLLKRVKKTFYPFEKADFADPAVRQQLRDIMPGADLDDPAVQDALRTQAQLPTAILDELRVLGQEAYQTAVSITMPTLILQGKQDDVVQPHFTRQLMAQIRGEVAYREFPGNHTAFKHTPPATFDFVESITQYISQQLQPATSGVIQTAV